MKRKFGVTDWTVARSPGGEMGFDTTMKAIIDMMIQGEFFKCPRQKKGKKERRRKVSSTIKLIRITKGGQVKE